MEKLIQFEKKLLTLLPTLPPEIDRPWVLATYLSLKMATELNYTDDAFSKLPNQDQIDFLSKNLSFSFQDIQKLSKGNNTWEAGYFFNNAIFRMVALAEIGLKVLFKRKTTIDAPDNYWWLSKWYENTFTQKLGNIQNARKRVNHFKHDTRSKNKNNKVFEKMSEGIKAFQELLSLLEHIASLTNQASEYAEPPR